MSKGGVRTLVEENLRVSMVVVQVPPASTVPSVLTRAACQVVGTSPSRRKQPSALMVLTTLARNTLVDARSFVRRLLSSG